jgi:hypothetical protein
MLLRLAQICRTGLPVLGCMALALVTAPVAAQSIESVDPSAAIDADLSQSAAQATDGTNYGQAQPTERYPAVSEAYSQPTVETYPAPAEMPAATAAPAAAGAATSGQQGTTYAQDDLIGAAEGLFGRGAEGLARLIQDILKEQGEPNAYIVGREGGGAFIFGVRYGSGTLYHRIEGNRPVYWTGPSIGLDAGANAGNTFVLVYNLDDSEELYERFPAGEGQAYLVGGFTASYLRKGNTVLIPIRVGAGLRLGVNAGYMRFSHRQRWLPF